MTLRAQMALPLHSHGGVFLYSLCDSVPESCMQCQNTFKCICSTIIHMVTLNKMKFLYNFLLCHIQIKVGLVCVGISMAFGALFVKMYRVHAIFKKAIAQFKKIVSFCMIHSFLY